MPYHILTRITESSELWSPVIDTDLSWKKAAVVDRIFMSEAECNEYIEDAVRRGEENYQFVNPNLHKIVEITGEEPSYLETVNEFLKEQNAL